MRRDSRLSGVLHVLLHLAQKEGPVTSEVLAKAMDMTTTSKSAFKVIDLPSS